MSYLKQKSSFNIDSAKELIKISYYAPSVHCSYYGCFQFMKYTLKNYNKTTYELIESDCMAYAGGTHGYMINNILSILRTNLNDTQQYTQIKRLIKDLKSFRIISDYFNVQILDEEANKSLRFSEQIIRTIQQNIK